MKKIGLFFILFFIFVASVSAATIDITSPSLPFFNSTSVSVDYSVSNIIGSSSCWFTSDAGNTNFSFSCGSQIGQLSFSQGPQTLSLFVSDDSGINSDSASFLIDSISPSISFSSFTDGSGTNASRNFIIEGIVANDTNLQNITFRAINSSGANTDFVSLSSPFIMNTTFLPDGRYTFLGFATDIAGNKAFTETRAITLDTTPPNVSLSPLIVESKSLILSLSVMDSLSGSSGICFSNRGIVNKDIDITDLNLSCRTNYTYSVNCSDYAGNIGIFSGNFNTGSCIDGGGETKSKASGGGSSSGTSWTTAYAVSEEKFSYGDAQTYLISSGERVSFSYSGRTYFIALSQVNEGTARVLITPGNQEETLTLGDPVSFEINGDNTYDLSVTLNEILGNDAQITIQKINQDSFLGNSKTSSEKNNSFLQPYSWFGVLEILGFVFVVVLLVFLFHIIFKNKSSKNKNLDENF